ncbi:MAG: glycosyltransferase family 4 protein [Bacteroidales bacterium]
MKIVVTGTRGIPNIMGGVETHCEELFPRIASSGKYDVTVIRRTSYANDNLTSYKGVNLVDINTPRQKSFEAIIHTFRGVVRAKRLKADIVHLHAVGPSIVTPIARLLGLKVVFTHHGFDYDRDKWGFVAKSIIKLGERFSVKYATEVIVISDVIKSHIEKKYNRTDSTLIYNGGSDTNKCETPEYFKELGIEKGKYILAMCRFVPEKNLHHLVEAFSRLNRTDCKLVIAGDSDFEDEYSTNLKQLAKDNGAILTGFVRGDKRDSLLTNARCFVLPSSHEGLPIALLEAMNYDLPVIVSDIPANLEVGLEQSVYFQMGNIDELTKKLDIELNRDFKNIKYDMSKYNWDTIAAQTMNVYSKILKK